MHLVRHYGMVSVVEDVEEPAVSGEGHVKIGAAYGCGFGVEQCDLSCASNGVR